MSERDDRQRDVQRNDQQPGNGPAGQRGPPPARGPSATEALGKPITKGYVAVFAMVLAVVAVAQGLLDLLLDAFEVFAYGQGIGTTLSVLLAVYLGATLEEDSTTVYAASGAAGLVGVLVLSVVEGILSQATGPGPNYRPAFGDAIVGAIVLAIVAAIAALVGAYVGLNYDPEGMFPRTPAGGAAPRGGGQPPGQGRPQGPRGPPEGDQRGRSGEAEPGDDVGTGRERDRGGPQ